MNKKAIAIDVLKHPIIKKLLESKIATTSTINKLIADEIIKESDGGIDKLLKNLAVRVPSSVIDAALKHPESPNGDQVGDVEKATLEFSKQFDQVLGQVKVFIDEYLKGEKEGEPEQLKVQFDKIITPTLELADPQVEGQSPFKELRDIAIAFQSSDPKKSVTEAFQALVNWQTDSEKIEPEMAAQAMTNATKPQEGDKTTVPVTSQIADNPEAIEKLQQDPKAKEKIVQQAQADIKAHPEKAEEIKADAKELEDELADPKDEIPDDVPKKDFAEKFEEEFEGGIPSLENSFDYFLDTFVSARYFDDQAKAINDVMKGLALFREKMKTLKQRGLVAENQEPKPVPETILQQLTKKKKEMIVPLKTMAQMLKNFKQKQDLFSKERKDMVREEAAKLQAVLRDVKVLLLKTKIAIGPTQPEPLQEQTKQEKIENIKKVYAKVRPAMLNISKLIRNFKDPNDDSGVSVSAVTKSMREIEQQLKTVAPYFSRKQTSFTKDKISFDNLAGLIKRFANEIADIIDNLNEVIGTGELTRQDTKGIVDKINELEVDIEKYIGAPKQPMPPEVKSVEAELDDEEGGKEQEKDAEEEAKELSKEEFLKQYRYLTDRVAMLTNALENNDDLDENEFYKLIGLYLNPDEKAFDELIGNYLVPEPMNEAPNEPRQFQVDKDKVLELVKGIEAQFEKIEQEGEPENIQKMIEEFIELYNQLEGIASKTRDEIISKIEPDDAKDFIVNLLTYFHFRKNYSKGMDLKRYFAYISDRMLKVSKDAEDYFEIEGPRNVEGGKLLRLVSTKQTLEHKQRSLKFIELQYDSDQKAPAADTEKTTGDEEQEEINYEENPQELTNLATNTSSEEINKFIEWYKQQTINESDFREGGKWEELAQKFYRETLPDEGLVAGNKGFEFEVRRRAANMLKDLTEMNKASSEGFNKLFSREILTVVAEPDTEEETKDSKETDDSSKVEDYEEEVEIETEKAVENSEIELPTATEEERQKLANDIKDALEPKPEDEEEVDELINQELGRMADEMEQESEKEDADPEKELEEIINSIEKLDYEDLFKKPGDNRELSDKVIKWLKANKDDFFVDRDKTYGKGEGLQFIKSVEDRRDNEKKQDIKIYLDKKPPLGLNTFATISNFLKAMEKKKMLQQNEEEDKITKKVEKIVEMFLLKENESDSSTGSIVLRFVFEGKTLSLGHKMEKDEDNNIIISQISSVGTMFRDFSPKNDQQSYEDVLLSLKNNLKPVSTNIFGKAMKAIKAPFVDILEEKLEKIIEMKLEDYISDNRITRTAFPSGVLDPKHDGKDIDALFRTFTDGQIDSGSPLSMLSKISKNLGGPYPAYFSNLLRGNTRERAEAQQKINQAVDGKQFYQSISGLYQHEMAAVIAFAKSRKNIASDEKIMYECRLLIQYWLSFNEEGQGKNQNVFDLYYSASKWYDQYRKVLAMAGIKAEDKIIVDDPTMEEKLTRKLEKIIEIYLKRK